MMKTKVVFILLAVGLGLGLGLVWVLGGGSPVAYAQGPDGTSTYYVAPSCAGVPEPCYTTVQGAVDAADDPGDVIKIATGVYTDVRGRPAPAVYGSSRIITQVVLITKTVTIRGGYTTAFADPPDPVANPTTLDAQGQGRVLLIAGNITPTVEGLRITGGDAAGLAGAGLAWDQDGCGGVYVISATVTIRDNRVFNNSGVDYGGGLCLLYNDATLSNNIISANTAREGGGLKLPFSNATVSGNTFSANTAADVGGGLELTLCNDATVSGNTFCGDTATRVGGGLQLTLCNDATVSGNTFSASTANYGGGLHLDDSDATLINNIIVDNQANTAGSGLHIHDGSSARLLHTTIARNTGGGGGRSWLWREGWW